MVGIVKNSQVKPQNSSNKSNRCFELWRHPVFNFSAILHIASSHAIHIWCIMWTFKWNLGIFQQKFSKSILFLTAPHAPTYSYHSNHRSCDWWGEVWLRKAVPTMWMEDLCKGFFTFLWIMMIKHPSSTYNNVLYFVKIATFLFPYS